MRPVISDEEVLNRNLVTLKIQDKQAKKYWCMDLPFQDTSEKALFKEHQKR